MYDMARKEKSMIAKKDLIDRANADGAMDKMNHLISAAHILNCEANSLVEEASDLMDKYGLLLGDLKMRHNSFVRSADMYFSTFASMVKNEKNKMDMFKDLDDFDKSFRKWAKIENPIGKNEGSK
jgi:hypothetical protein